MPSNNGDRDDHTSKDASTHWAKTLSWVGAAICGITGLLLRSPNSLAEAVVSGFAAGAGGGLIGGLIGAYLDGGFSAVLPREQRTLAVVLILIILLFGGITFLGLYLGGAFG